MTDKSFERLRRRIAAQLLVAGKRRGVTNVYMEPQEGDASGAEFQEQSVLFVDRGKWSYITGFPLRRNGVDSVIAQYDTKPFAGPLWLLALEAANAVNDGVELDTPVTVDKKGIVATRFTFYYRSQSEFVEALLNGIDDNDRVLEWWKREYERLRRAKQRL